MVLPTSEVPIWKNKLTAPHTHYLRCTLQLLPCPGMGFSRQHGHVGRHSCSRRLGVGALSHMRCVDGIAPMGGVRVYEVRVEFRLSRFMCGFAHNILMRKAHEYLGWQARSRRVRQKYSALRLSISHDLTSGAFRDGFDS